MLLPDEWEWLRATTTGGPERYGMKVATMLRQDLSDARQAWLKAALHDPEEYQRRSQSDFPAEVNHEGERLDFHSLRHTCGTWLAMAGAHPNAVQAVMRHSTITLTMDTYGHLFPGQEAETVERFPDMMGVREPSLRATGTADPVAQPQQYPRQCAQQSGRAVMRADAAGCTNGGDLGRPAQAPKSLPDRKIRNAPRDGARRCASPQDGGAPGTRTPDPLIKSHYRRPRAGASH
jgi:hypothetical protein